MKAVKRDAWEMKDSGIEWIGKYPKSWIIYPAKGVFTEVKNKNTSVKYTNQFSFRYGEIVDKNSHGNIDEKLKDTISAYNIVQPDTIMINGLNLNYDFISQRVAIVKTTGIITSAYLALFPDKTRINPQFAVYLFKAYDAQQVFHGMGSGIRKTLSFQNFKNIFIVTSTLDNQQVIADYLDDRCAKIDAIIAEAKASIEEYKELKQSMIAGKVKMGVRPASTVKNSGVNYLGDIPSHWQVRRISTLYEESKEDGRSDLPILMVSINSGISDTEVSDENRIRKVIRSEDKTIYKVVHPNYLAYNMMRAWQGAFGAAQVDGLVSPAYVVVRPKDESVDSRYVEALLRTPKMMEVIRGRSYGIADFRLRLYWPYFKDIKICLPPIREQKEIVEYLKNGLGKIDELISEKQSLIEDLESYKKSLIYEVVTGKCKVVD